MTLDSPKAPQVGERNSTRIKTRLNMAWGTPKKDFLTQKKQLFSNLLQTENEHKMRDSNLEQDDTNSIFQYKFKHAEKNVYENYFEKNMNPQQISISDEQIEMGVKKENLNEILSTNNTIYTTTKNVSQFVPELSKENDGPRTFSFLEE